MVKIGICKLQMWEIQQPFYGTFTYHFKFKIKKTNRLTNSKIRNSRDGEAIWLTKDHKVSDADEQERLKQLGPQAWHPGKSRINGLAVSRAMGDFFVKNEGLGLIGEPFVSQVYKIEPKDSILIVASDGVILFLDHFSFY